VHKRKRLCQIRKKGKDGSKEILGETNIGNLGK
jgi:hypothetical protein